MDRTGSTVLRVQGKDLVQEHLCFSEGIEQPLSAVFCDSTQMIQVSLLSETQ